MQLNNKVKAYIKKYGKNLDNVREPNSKAWWLKPKPYNTVKNKMLSVGEFKYISTRSDLYCYGNIKNQLNTSTQVIMCRPGD